MSLLRGKPAVAWLLASAALWHCSLESSGLAPGAAAGGSPNGGGGSGMQGGAGAGSSAGVGGAAGEAGGPGGSPGAGASGSAGAAGMSGASGSGGEAGAGGNPPRPCDPEKSEFSVKSAPDSCFFLVGGDSKSVPPSGLTFRGFDEAYFDCMDLGASLATLADQQEYLDVRAIIANDVPVAVGTDSVWLGAKTFVNPLSVTQQELAESFRWLDGETWAFTSPSTPPWSSTQPSLTTDEVCINMRGDAGAAHLMNNANCITKLRFALCERPLATLRPAAPAR